MEINQSSSEFVGRKRTNVLPIRTREISVGDRKSKKQRTDRSSCNETAVVSLDSRFFGGRGKGPYRMRGTRLQPIS
jgi:hypothetical protein